MTVFHWFLSFRDADANRNLGGCMVITEDEDPPSIERAADSAWELGCNPGGEVMGFTAEGSSPDIAQAVEGMPPGKLFSKEEVQELWAPYGVQARRPTD